MHPQRIALKNLKLRLRKIIFQISQAKLNLLHWKYNGAAWTKVWAVSVDTNMLVRLKDTGNGYNNVTGLKKHCFAVILSNLFKH